MRTLREEYDTNVGPDDIRLRTEVQDFMQEYKAHNPIRTGPDEDPVEYSNPDNDFAPQSHREYSEPRPAPPLTTEDSARFGTAAKYPAR